MTYEERVKHRDLVERLTRLRLRIEEGEGSSPLTREEARELVAIVEETVDGESSIRQCTFNDYDDFLHRGTKSPLRELSFVLYQAYVEVVPLGRGETIHIGAYFFRRKGSPSP